MAVKEFYLVNRLGSTNVPLSYFLADTAAELTGTVEGSLGYALDTKLLYIRKAAGWVNTAGTGGSPTATTVEVNLGTPKWSGRFTITDAAIGVTSKVLCWQAPGPYTGKGTRADESEIQPVSIISVVPAAGSAVVHWETPLIVTFAFNPLMQLGKDPQAIVNGYAKRLGKVSGNVKFSYTIFG